MTKMRRDAAQAAVLDLGWRLVLGRLHTSVPVASFEQAALVVTDLASVGAEATEHLDVQVRPGRVQLVLTTPDQQWVTDDDLATARAVSDVVAALGLRTEPGQGRTGAVQGIELAIDALDVPAVRPFWKAVLGYVDEPGEGDGEPHGIVDPRGQGPAFWFQQMDAPRPQRNRIHVDVDVPHDEAEARLAAALAAGGVLVSDAVAPAFWVLADAEGNEACICTWQNRDDRDPDVG